MKHKTAPCTRLNLKTNKLAKELFKHTQADGRF